jgi:hypothetical protein
MLPSKEEVLELRKRVESFKCTGCEHSTLSPFPPFPITTTKKTSEEKGEVLDAVEKAEVVVDEAARMMAKLNCEALKINLAEDEKLILGYPLKLLKDRFGRIQVQNIVLEHISYDAYMLQVYKHFE